MIKPSDIEIDFIKKHGFSDEDITDPTFVEAISRPVCKMRPGEMCAQCDPLTTVSTATRLTTQDLQFILKRIAFDSKIEGDAIVYKVRSIDLPEYLIY